MNARSKPTRPKPVLSKSARASRATVDRARSLTQLEGDDWGAAPYDSYLVTRCHDARNVAIGALTIEQLRMLIGQRIGLRYVVPIAIEAVERAPFAQGDFYPGDLLTVLALVPNDVWSEMLECRERLCAVIRDADTAVERIEDEDERVALRRILSQCTAALAAR